MSGFYFPLLIPFLFLADSSLSQSGIIKATNSPIARHECGAVAFKGKLYLIGGRGIKPVEAFDPKTSTWTKLGKTPMEMHHFQPVVYGKEIYILSAFTGGYPRETPLEKIWIYNPMTDVWREGPAVPESRRRGGGGAVTIGEKIYVAGGIIDGHNSGTIPWADEFDPETGVWKQLPDMPNRRDHTVAVGDKKYMYLLGGRTSDYHEEGNFTAFFKTTTAKVDRYSFSEKKWVTLPAEMPVATAGAGAVLSKGKIYYMGGESGQKAAHNEVQIYDIKTGNWSVGTKLERGRHGSQVAIIGRRAYIASGSGNQGGGPELYSIESIALD